MNTNNNNTNNDNTNNDNDNLEVGTSEYYADNCLGLPPKSYDNFEKVVDYLLKLPPNEQNPAKVYRKDIVNLSVVINSMMTAFALNLLRKGDMINFIQLQQNKHIEILTSVATGIAIEIRMKFGATCPFMSVDTTRLAFDLVAKSFLELDIKNN